MSDHEKILNIYLIHLKKHISDILISLGYCITEPKVHITDIYQNVDIYTVEIDLCGYISTLKCAESIDHFKDRITNIFCKLYPGILIKLDIDNTKIILKFDLNPNPDITLVDLPHEIIKLMMKYMSYNDIINVCQINCTLTYIWYEDEFWEQNLLEHILGKNIRKIWKGTNRKTYKYYDKIMNSKYATMHVRKMWGFEMKLTGQREEYDFTFLMRNGDIFRIEDIDSRSYYLVNINKKQYDMKKLIMRDIIGENILYPKYGLDYWDAEKINIIKGDTTKSDTSYIELYKERINVPYLHIDEKIINNLEYYGWMYTKYITLYAKFKYSNDIYVIFIQNPGIGRPYVFDMPVKLDSYISFGMVENLKKTEYLEREIYGDVGFGVLKNFRKNILKMYNVKEGNYAKAVLL